MVEHYLAQVISFLNLEAAPITLQPLLIQLAAIVIYAIFIFKFYKFLGSRDVFGLDEKMEQKGIVKSISRSIFSFFEYVFLFPVFAFLWGGFLFFILSFIAQGTASQLLLTSMVIVAAVRVTAYYTEELSKDLAKMLPFALLGISIVNSSYFSIQQAFEKLMALPGELITGVHYLIFIVILELTLRTVYLLTTTASTRKAKAEKHE